MIEPHEFRPSVRIFGCWFRKSEKAIDSIEAAGYTYRVNWGKVTNRNDTATTKQAHVNVMQQDSLTFANRKTGKSDRFKLVMFPSHASARLPLAVTWHAMRPMCKSHIGFFRNTNGWWSHKQIRLSKNIRKKGVKYRMHPIPWSCPAFSLEPTSLSFEMLVTLLTTKQTQTPKLGQNMSRLTTINYYLAWHGVPAISNWDSKACPAFAG